MFPRARLVSGGRGSNVVRTTCFGNEKIPINKWTAHIHSPLRCQALVMKCTGMVLARWLIYRSCLLGSFTPSAVSPDNT